MIAEQVACALFWYSVGILVTTAMVLLSRHKKGD